MSPHLPLSLKFSSDQRFAGFLGLDAARALAQAVAAGESADWLYLAGPAGSGKTHLLLAACALAQEHGRRAVYLPLKALAGRLTDALPGHEAADLICLDDLDAIVGSNEDEVALFHCHNRARAQGTHVIYSALAMPAARAFTLPDLASRLEQCTRLLLEVPDEQVRRQVLRERGARRGLELDESVLEFLFRRVGRDLASLTVLLDRIDRESLAAQRRVTVPFLKQMLGKAGAGPPP